MWDLVEATPLLRIDDAHCRAVASVACHPSEPTLVTCSYDGTALVWKGQYS